MQESSAAIEEVYAMPDIGPDDAAQEAQRLLQHQHRDMQRKALGHTFTFTLTQFYSRLRMFFCHVL